MVAFSSSHKVQKQSSGPGKGQTRAAAHRRAQAGSTVASAPAVRPYGLQMQVAQRAAPHIQRTTDEMAETYQLRAAMLKAIGNQLSLTPPAFKRRIEYLKNLRAQVPEMSNDDMKAKLPDLIVSSGQSNATVNNNRIPLTPTSTQPPTDWTDPALFVQQSRDYQLHLMLTYLESSDEFAAVKIREMLAAMNTNVRQVQWFAYNTGGFSAAGRLAVADQQAPQAEVLLGPPMLTIMDQIPRGGSAQAIQMLPTLYHEVYHVYESYREAGLGNEPQRPNLTQQAMEALGQQASVGTDATRYAVSMAATVESEVFAELYGHTAVITSNLKSRPMWLQNIGTVRVNSKSGIEADVAMRLQQMKLIVGPEKSRDISLQLLERAKNEGFLHADTIAMFEQTIERILPATP